MMSHEIRLFGDDAEKIVLGTPELIEKLLSYLDLLSIKHLAEFHKVTRGILGNTFAWSNVIKRTFPEDEITNTWTRFISGDETEAEGRVFSTAPYFQVQNMDQKCEL